jgi:hypothetical protein
MVIEKISANGNEKLARYAIVGVLILIGVWFVCEHSDNPVFSSVI